MEQRQPMLHADMAAAGADGFIEMVGRLLGAEHSAVAGTEALDRLLIEKNFRYRLEIDGISCAGRALRHGVELADPVQRITEEIEPQRLADAGREDVENAAAHRELAGLAHRVGTVVAIVEEEGDEILD